MIKIGGFLTLICLTTLVFGGHQSLYGQVQTDSLMARFPLLWSASLTEERVKPGKPMYFSLQEAFFCRQERHWEKTTGIPLKFRLSGWEQAQWLEGKSRILHPLP